MNSLRLLVATALCAWLVLPSQSLAQCPGTFELTVTLLTASYPEETGLTDDAAAFCCKAAPASGCNHLPRAFALVQAVTFTISDSFGDGIAVRTGVLQRLSRGTEIASGGNFGSQDTENFCLEFLCTDETACNYNPDAEEINPLEGVCTGRLVWSRIRL